MLLIMNIPLIGLWVKILSIPYKYLYPGVLMLVCVGVYSVNNNPFDLIVVFVFSAIGYGMVLARLSPAPMMLGLVLGPMMEENFRRAMLLARGDPLALIERPITGSLLAASVCLLLWPLFQRAIHRKTLKNGALEDQPEP